MRTNGIGKYEMGRTKRHEMDEGLPGNIIYQKQIFAKAKIIKLLIFLQAYFRNRNIKIFTKDQNGFSYQIISIPIC